jgi:hypothetical protein
VAGVGSRLEVADIVRAHLDDHRQRYALHAAQQAAVHAMLACRTAALGGHLEVCTHCAAQISMPATLPYTTLLRTMAWLHWPT